MAEAIGVASGILTLAAFALQSSVSLYQVVDSFKSSKRAIRELKEEIEALDVVLQSLQQSTTDDNPDLSALKLPLFRCGQACKDFGAVIVKCTAHSSGSRTSFRDWAKLQYMGEDVAGFKNMLAGYKSTINIALASANFRTAAITANVLKEYKEMIANTTTDLEEHLQAIDNNLQARSFSGVRMSVEDTAERDRIQEEIDSTKQCLTICAKVSEHVDQIQPNVFIDVSMPEDNQPVVVGTLGGLISAKRVTANALSNCKNVLTHTASELEEHLQDIGSKMQTLFPQNPRSLSEDMTEREVQEEKQSVEQCLTICAEASEKADRERINVLEDVSAAQDSHQVIVTTLGDLISATRVTAADRAVQWAGQMNDATVQQLSQDRVAGLSSQAAMWKAMESRADISAKFKDQYGSGHKLV